MSQYGCIIGPNLNKWANDPIKGFLLAPPRKNTLKRGSLNKTRSDAFWKSARLETSAPIRRQTRLYFGAGVSWAHKNSPKKWPSFWSPFALQTAYPQKEQDRRVPLASKSQAPTRSSALEAVDESPEAEVSPARVWRGGGGRFPRFPKTNLEN